MLQESGTSWLPSGQKLSHPGSGILPYPNAFRKNGPRRSHTHPFPLGLEAGSRYIPQAGLRVMTVLPLPPEFWDCRCATAHPALQVVFKVFIQDLGLFCKAQSYGQLKEWMSDLPGTKGTAGDTTL